MTSLSIFPSKKHKLFQQEKQDLKPFDNKHQSDFHQSSTRQKQTNKQIYRKYVVAVYSYFVLTINFSFISQRNDAERDFSDSVLINFIASP